HMQALFAQGGEIATDAAEVSRTLGAPERARNFLLNFDHADISFCKVVVKRNLQALQEEQGSLLVFAQSIQQVACGMLFGSATLPLWGGQRWMDLIPFIQESQEASREASDLWWRETSLCLGAGLKSGFLHGKQQLLQFCRPPQAQLFCQVGQLAQDMYQTE